MSATPLPVGFIPLVDAAPLIVASEMGFDQEEGLSLELVRAASWSSLRDMLVFGRVDAAHLLSPVPVAMALGLGGVSSQISALLVLSVNGNVVGVSRDLAKRLPSPRRDGSEFEARSVGQRLVAAANRRLTIGVPFPFSMHAELLYYWLSASGLPAPQAVNIRTVPPPMMADALEAGEIDAFCVGEPWGSQTIERGLGELILPGSAIWSFAPEKVLAVRSHWADDEPDLTARLMRSIWKACRWLGQGGVRTTAAELLADSRYLDLPSEVIDRGLSGQLVVTPTGDTKRFPGFLEFYDGAANFPWKSQAAWMGNQIAGRLGLDRAQAMDKARGVFRSELYRRYLGEAGAILPGASEKVEGGISAKTGVASEHGRLILAENRFFDSRIFDPMRAE